MRTNTKSKPTAFTHEGGPAKNINALSALRRSVLSCFLFESEFYEDGKKISDRIAELCAKVTPAQIAELAIEARETANLRHVPLWLLIQLIKHGSGTSLVSKTIERAIQRADEVGELVALYWKDGKLPLSAQMKKGLAAAITKFNAYQLAKYNRDTSVKLRDVLFLVHAKPSDEELFRKLVANELESPDTWEVALSSGANKKDTFERLMREGNLGYLALLRNLRNMVEAGCDQGLMRDAIVARKGAQRVLPFRYVAAARACPRMEPAIDQALCEAIAEMPPLTGRTTILVDVSGSMDMKLSGRSELMRIDAAAALASIVPGDVRVFTFSERTIEVPPRRGMAGVDAVIRSQAHDGTNLGRAVATLNRKVPHDRLIVITDEQSSDPVPDPTAKHAYLINVASNQNGVGYGRWVHIDGFSESVLRFIAEYERQSTD